MMNGYIGHWQEKMLLKIFKSKKGAFYKLMDLKGKAKKYSTKYQWHLKNAINKYNKSLIKHDSIPNNFSILVGNYGIRGGMGYRVVPKAFL